MKSKNTPKKINQNLLIASVSAVATLVAAFIPWMLNKYEAQKIPTPTPIIITATSAPTATLPVTETAAIEPSPTAAPAESDSQTGIFDIYLAYDELGDFRSTSFSPTQTIFLFFSVNDPQNRNIVKTVWTAVEVDGYQSNTVIYKSEDKVTPPQFTIRTGKESWEIGKYKIELYLNGTLDEVIEFEVAN